MTNHPKPLNKTQAKIMDLRENRTIELSVFLYLCQIKLFLQQLRDLRKINFNHALRK